MAYVDLSLFIAAPVETVFDAIAHPENFERVAPQLKRIEFLSETRRGTGTSFRETRVMKGRETVTQLEITEYAENDRVRMVTDSHGTVWDTLFTVAPDGDGTRLTLSMDARPHVWSQKLMVPLIRKMVARAVEDDMQGVKSWCEGRAQT